MSSVDIVHTAPRYRRLDLVAAALLAVATLFRIWYAGGHELLQDETYYWQWSRHLDWGYYDNTPLAAPLIRFFTLLLGDTSLGVRAGAILCALIASVCIYGLAKRLFDPEIAFIALCLANVIPLFAAGAIIMTMDPPQLALWAAAMWAIWSARSTSGGRSTALWLLSGVLAGLTAQAKLNGLLLLPGVLLFLAISPVDRFWLRRPEPYLAALAALAVFSPFVWWNHTHGNAFWIHIGVMGSRSGPHDPPLKFFFRYIGDQALMLSPIFFLIYIGALVSTVRRGLRERGSALLFVWSMSAVVFVATAVVSLRSKVEANWPAAAYVAGVMLLAIALRDLWRSGRPGRRAWAVAALALAAMMSTIAYFPQGIYAVATFGKRDPAVALAPYAKVDRINELYGWRTLAARIAAERRAMGGDPFVFGINYRMPSEAAFYLPDRPQTYSLFLNDRANQYMFWEDERALIGRNGIFVDDSDTPDHLDDLRAVFRRVDVEPPLLVHRNPPYGPTTPIRTVQITRCYDFKGYDVRRWQQGW
ncbi:MAG: glycosyltransferase family 39 protein [Capsulimonadaceae bacterium]